MNILSHVYHWYFSRKALPYWGILGLDAAITALCGILIMWIQLGPQGFVDNVTPVLWGVLISTFIYILCFRAFHTYSGIIRYSTTRDLHRVFLAVICGSVVIFLIYTVIRSLGVTQEYVRFPNRIYGPIAACFVAVFMSLLRLLVRAAYDGYRITKTTPKALVYGIQEGGVGLAVSLRETANYHLQGFIAPKGEIHADWLMGVRVFQDDDEKLFDYIKEQGISTLFVSPLQTVTFRNQPELVDALMTAGVQILMLPPVEEWDGKTKLNYQQLHEVDIEDLLPRDKIEVDMRAIGEMLRGQRILITGAAGSIGSEMARQVAKFEPASLILIDQAETPMHDVRLYMKNNHPDLACETIVTSICKAERMERVFADHRPQYVFHAAAYKHVPMMEDNPAEAVQNNIYGTRVIADLAVKYGTKKFVMISTDKAVNPTNVMGCSKRICEIYCQSLNAHLRQQEAESASETGCQFVTTRFGNVLGSNGSVIPIFKKQIRKGGPVKVTHPDIIRYFMLIPEACRLVLEAGTMGKGGEIFVFDMGKPVKIVDLARRMIKLSGAKNIEIQFTGLRDGEKLYEEVLNDAEQTSATPHPKIKVAKVREYPYELALQNEKELHQLSLTYDDMRIVAKMKDIVPEYKSQQSKYEVLDVER